jgi:hypothetical protein
LVQKEFLNTGIFPYQVDAYCHLVKHVEPYRYPDRISTAVYGEFTAKNTFIRNHRPGCTIDFSTEEKTI